MDLSKKNSVLKTSENLTNTCHLHPLVAVPAVYVMMVDFSNEQRKKKKFIIILLPSAFLLIHDFSKARLEKRGNLL